MRITQQMLNKSYNKRMNTNLGTLTKSNDKMTSQRAFNKGYENVADAGRALRVRKLIDDNERYQTAVRDATGRAAAAEDSIRTINTRMITAKEKLMQGMNGTYDQSDMKKIATELQAFQEEVLQVMNTQYTDKYVFAAAGNADGSAPFTVSDSGKLLYNGTRMVDIVASPYNGRPSLFDGINYQEIPYNTHNYVDIGFGYDLNMDGQVDPNTAFKDTYSGAECFGFGKASTDMPLNAYDLLGQMIEGLQLNNSEILDDCLDTISETMDAMLTAVTDIGSRSVTLQNTKASLENTYITLAESQNNVEGLDIAEETIYNKTAEMAWMVTLQMGSKILPQTIFDFLR